ncbi:MAG: alginate export family protein [Ignavibacteriae bacterium]|nr:alginate export family protein [Ignavibacteriota bacterium]
MKNLLVLLISITIINTYLNAQTDSVKQNDWKFSGHVLMRSEMDGKDFDNKTYPPTYTLMRTRINVEKNLFEDVSFFIQLQDSRVWGQTANPTKNLANIDMHQGFVDIKNLFDVPLSVRIGRFEIEYGTGRLLGPNPWNYVARAWDGYRIRYGSDKNSFIDAFSLSHTALTDPTKFPFNAKGDTSYNIYGLWTALKIETEHKFEVLAYYEINNKKTDSLHKDFDLLTGGFNYEYKSGNFNIALETAYQGGRGIFGDKDKQNKKNKEASSYLGCLKIQYTFNTLTASLNAEIISGTKPSETEKTHTFWRPWGTVHQFYGYMDYFTGDLTQSTANLGLNDLHIKCKYAPKASPFSLDVALWYFMTNQKSATGKSTLGEELNIVGRYNWHENIFVELGGGLFFAGEVMKEIYNPSLAEKDISFWSYIRLDVRL